MLILAAIVALAAHGSVSNAATLTCGSYWDTSLLNEIPDDRKYCRSATMEGQIEPQDVDALKAFLRRDPFVKYLRVHSPGGSVDAAIKIGHIVRSRFISVETAELDTPFGRAQCLSEDYARKELRWELLPPHKNSIGPLELEEAMRRDEEKLKTIKIDPVRIKRFREDCKRWTDCRIEGKCCLSACMLVVVGGISWEVKNIGLHRPSLKDLSPRSYEDVKTALSEAQSRMRNYMSEMGVPDRVFEAMMNVPPDEVRLLDKVSAAALFFGIPNESPALEKYQERRDAYFSPSVYDWVSRECPGKGSDPRWHSHSCIYDALQREFLQRAAKPIR
jgi:hypothetical protein